MDSRETPQKIDFFDPFQSRLCRDVRNDLSESLLVAISYKDIGPARKIAEKYNYQGMLPPQVKNYIDDRIEKYEAVISQIKSADLTGDDTFEIALLLWDQRVFFEVHEWLEQKWLKANGIEKIIMQALIRSAGTYVHLQYGRLAGAEKMASKAVESLREYKKNIPEFINISLLISHLETLNPVPPRLGAEDFIKK